MILKAVDTPDSDVLTIILRMLQNADVPNRQGKTYMIEMLLVLYNEEGEKRVSPSFTELCERVGDLYGRKKETVNAAINLAFRKSNALKVYGSKSSREFIYRIYEELLLWRLSNVQK